MATLKAPHGRGTIDVPEELVERYTSAGWTEVKEQGRKSAKGSGDKK